MIYQRKNHSAQEWAIGHRFLGLFVLGRLGLEKISLGQSQASKGFVSLDENRMASQTEILSPIAHL